MKINDFEKIVIERNWDEDSFGEFLEKEINDKLDFESSFVARKLTDEEIDYEYVDISLIDNLENLPLIEEHHSCSCCECEEESYIEKRFNKNMKSVYKLGLFLLREGIHYDDIVQEGLLALTEVNNLFEDNFYFEKYKDYFIAKKMIEHIKSYVEYRKIAFKKYIEDEKEKEVHLKLHSKVHLMDKNDEIKEAEKIKNEEHQEAIKRLEKFSKDLFEYSNLKYRLSFREIEAISLYFGLDSDERKNFTDIEKIMQIDSNTVDKILKEALYKLSVVNEKVEIW